MSPDYYSVPSGAKTLWDIFPKGIDHRLANAIEYMYRAGRKPGNPARDDVMKALDNINHWLADPANDQARLTGDR